MFRFRRIKHTGLSKLSALGAGAVVIAGGTVLGLSGTAAAGTCGDVFDPRVSGAKAYRQLSRDAFPGTTEADVNECRAVTCGVYGL